MSRRKGPWLSGFCNPTNPADSHGRCRVAYRDDLSCGCACHVIAEAVVAGVAVTLVTPTGWLVTAEEPETDAWFAARRSGITGTDLPKILGISRYGNALSVWLDKRGELTDSAGEEARWGNLLEDVVAREWAHRHGTTVTPVGVLGHVDDPWRRVSLDRIVDTCPDGDGPCSLEVKTRSAYKAREYRDGIPDDVLAQVQWGAGVTGYTHSHVAVLIGGQKLESFRVDADPVVIDYLIGQARPVWDAVLDGTPPAAVPDGDGVLLDLLNALYPRRGGDRDLPADEAHRWLDQYADAADMKSTADTLQTEAKTALVQLLDDGDTGRVDGAPVFTYKAPDPRHTVTAAALKKLRADDPDTYARLVDAGVITTTTPGPRFNLKGTR